MAGYAIQEVFDLFPQRVARRDRYLLSTLRSPENALLVRTIQICFRLTPDHRYLSPFLSAQPANLDLRGNLSCMLRCYESQLLVLLCPVSLTPTSNLGRPLVKEEIANVERMRSEIRDNFSGALRRQKTCPNESEIVEISKDAAGQGSSQLPNAIVEPVNMARAEDEIIVLRKLHKLVRLFRS